MYTNEQYTSVEQHDVILKLLLSLLPVGAATTGLCSSGEVAGPTEVGVWAGGAVVVVGAAGAAGAPSTIGGWTDGC